MALLHLTEEQIRTWTREQKDRWWFENVWRGDMPQLTLRSAITGFLLGLGTPFWVQVVNGALYARNLMRGPNSTGTGAPTRTIALQYNPDSLARSYQVQGVGGVLQVVDVAVVDDDIVGQRQPLRA